MPSLSNGFSCPSAPPAKEKPTIAGEYQTEAEAKRHCFSGVVVWANNRSKIYHFPGSRYYGHTKRGGYICESDALADGLRAAEKEKHSQ